MKISWKYINGHGPYAYAQVSVRKGSAVKSRHVAYLGREGGLLVPGKTVRIGDERVRVPEIPVRAGDVAPNSRKKGRVRQYVAVDADGDVVYVAGARTWSVGKTSSRLRASCRQAARSSRNRRRCPRRRVRGWRAAAWRSTKKSTAGCQRRTRSSRVRRARETTCSGKPRRTAWRRTESSRTSGRTTSST